MQAECEQRPLQQDVADHSRGQAEPAAPEDLPHLILQQHDLPRRGVIGGSSAAQPDGDLMEQDVAALGPLLRHQGHDHDDDDEAGQHGGDVGRPSQPRRRGGLVTDDDAGDDRQGQLRYQVGHVEHRGRAGEVSHRQPPQLALGQGVPITPPKGSRLDALLPADSGPWPAADQDGRDDDTGQTPKERQLDGQAAAPGHPVAAGQHLARSGGERAPTSTNHSVPQTGRTRRGAGRAGSRPCAARSHRGLRSMAGQRCSLLSGESTDGHPVCDLLTRGIHDWEHAAARSEYGPRDLYRCDRAL